MSNSSKKDPADYVIGYDATIEDANLDELGLTYQGEPLTEDRALELGEQAARDADAYEAAERRAGREANLIPGGKSLSGGGKHSPVVQTRVPEETHAKLRYIAEVRSVTVSRLLRTAIDEFVEREGAAK